MPKQQKKFFITGTDTGVGKTFFTTVLIQALLNNNHSVMAFKPVAAGCELQKNQYVNDDALKIINRLNKPVSYAQVNPIALQPPIAPHIAAQQAGLELSVQQLKKLCPLQQYHEDFLLLEGAGGWLVPLNHQETYADYVVSESLDVILVVGLKLGCLNHALLTKQNIQTRGLNLIGWVANHIDKDMLHPQENIDTLTKALDCPLIAEIPYYNKQELSAEKQLNNAISCVKLGALFCDDSQSD